MRREYTREKLKLEYQGKTLQKDLKKKIEKKQPAVFMWLIQQSQKVIAQQILKNNQMINKYNNLDAQLQGVTFEYKSIDLGCNKCAWVSPCKMLCRGWPR